MLDLTDQMLNQHQMLEQQIRSLINRWIVISKGQKLDKQIKSYIKTSNAMAQQIKMSIIRSKIRSVEHNVRSTDPLVDQHIKYYIKRSIRRPTDPKLVYRSKVSSIN